MYVSSLKDFLRSQDVTLIFQANDSVFGTFKGTPVIIDFLRTLNGGRYCSFTWLFLYIKETHGWMRIEPWIEDKIKDIANFVIKMHSYLPLLEAAKTIRKKTSEEMIHRDANGEIMYQECDMYNYTRYLGHEVGRELSDAEGYFRSYFRMERYEMKND